MDFQQALVTELVKLSGLNLADIEDSLGVYLPDDRETKARGMIEDQKSQRFALRHPWLTGIPTLGLAPAASKANAISVIRRKLLRGDPELAAQVTALEDKKRRQGLEEFQADTDRTRAEQPERAVGMAAAALSPALLMALMNRQRQQQGG